MFVLFHLALLIASALAETTQTADEVLFGLPSASSTTPPFESRSVSAELPTSEENVDKTVVGVRDLQEVEQVAIRHNLEEQQMHQVQSAYPIDQQTSAQVSDRFPLISSTHIHPVVAHQPISHEYPVVQTVPIQTVPSYPTYPSSYPYPVSSYPVAMGTHYPHFRLQLRRTRPWTGHLVHSLFPYPYARPRTTSVPQTDHRVLVVVDPHLSSPPHHENFNDDTIFWE